MPTVEEARESIMQKFNTEWAGETQVAWDNLDYVSDGNEFVRVSMQHNIGSQASLGVTGNRVFRKFGFIFVQVFTKLKESAVRSDFLCQKALQIFSNNSDCVWFKNQQINHIGRESEGKYYQQNVSIEFIYDDIR